MSNILRFALVGIPLLVWQCAGYAQTAAQSAQGVSLSLPQSQALTAQPQSLSQPIGQSPGRTFTTPTSQQGVTELPDIGSTPQIKPNSTSSTEPNSATSNLPACSYFGSSGHCSNSAPGSSRLSSQQSGAADPSATPSVQTRTVAPGSTAIANPALTSQGFMQSSSIQMIHAGAGANNGILHSSIATPNTALGAMSTDAGGPANLTQASASTKSHVRGYDDSAIALPGHLTPNRSAAIAAPKPSRVNNSNSSGKTPPEPKKKVEACVVVHNAEVCS